MSEFCVKCCEKDAQIECMRARMQELKEENARLRLTNDALINDIAYYDGKFPKEMKDA